MKTNYSLFLAVLLLFCSPLAIAQNITAAVITDEILATLNELDPNAPASDDIIFESENITYYDQDGKKLNVDNKKEYQSNPDFTIGQMFADDDNVVRVVLYRKSTDAEKAQKESFQMSLNAMNPEYFRGTYAKPFSVTDIDGNVYTNENLKGKVVVVNFWFIGCVPCVEEIPVLNQLAEKYKEKDVVFLAVSYDGKSELEEFLTRQQFDYRIVPKNTSMAADYHVMAYPDHMIIDKKSVIQYKGIMQKDRLFDYFSQYIDLCLAAK
jgi:thiol-disulfide isomerase/thioredoxin